MKKGNLFYIQKHSRFLTHRRAQDSFEVRRRAPRRGARSIRHASGVALGTFQTFNTCQFVENVINNSFFTSWDIVRAQLCASNIGNEE